jgi:DNA-binding response OmpR family regulator
MISANKDTEKIALAAGADSFITKPFEIKHLLAVVKKYTSP